MMCMNKATWTKEDGQWLAQTRAHDVKPGDLIVVIKKDKSMQTMRAVRLVKDYGANDVALWEVA